MSRTKTSLIRRAKTRNRPKKLHGTFEQSFSSEANLQQAIARLLTRMPDITGVQILQGPQELGKDLVFYIRGGFGEPVLCACVVKNTKISGDATKSGGARTVFHQAEQVFDSAHIDSSGKSVRVERVYVITPYAISPSTITSIVGRLRERAGQVVFIGGSSLFDLFRQYWPDYFADEAEVIGQHITSTRILIEADNHLQGLADQYNLGRIDSYPTKVYVSQTLYRDVHDYDLSGVLINPLPDMLSFQKKFVRKDVEFIQDRLNDLRRGITFLAEWGLCGDKEKAAVYDSTSSVINCLLNAWRKVEAEELAEQLLAEKRDARVSVTLARETSKRVPSADDERWFREIDKTLVKIRKLSGQKTVELSAAAEHVKQLTVRRNKALSALKYKLSDLRSKLFSKRLDGVEALTNPQYSEACTLNECFSAAPAEIVVARKGLKVTFPKDLLDRWSGSLLIEGAAGFGKTSFCRWHALRDLERFTTGKSKTIPVYIPLYRFSKKAVTSFADTFLTSLGKSALLSKNAIKPDTRIRLYLDGLDEIASPERRRNLVHLAKTGDSDKYQIILTSRDYIHAPWLDWCPRITIGGFEPSDIQELVDRWLGPNSESHRAFWTQISDMPTLNQLMRTPLLATLVIMVFRQTGRLPESKTRLYEIFVNLLSGGWDLAKGVLRGSRFGERVKVMVLTNLAKALQERRRREFQTQDLKVAVSAVLSGAILKEWARIQDELMIDGLITKSGTVLQFAHHSFQEFLAAKELMASPQPLRVNKSLEAYLCGDEWWKEVIHFYVGLSTSPNEVLSWVADRINNIQSFSPAKVMTSQVKSLRLAITEAFPEYPAGEISAVGQYVYK